MNVLLVEDDERIIEFVRRGLEAEGHQATAQATAQAQAINKQTT